MAKDGPVQSSLFDLAVGQPQGMPSPPQPAQKDPPDHAARVQALDVRRSFIVEAPAGSGKTGLLVQRFLKLLGDPSVTQPEQVLAITFTVKATAEMRDRVLGHLEAARANHATGDASDFARQTRSLAQAVLDRDRQLGWSLLDQPNRLQIRTIDSVCGEIARTLPVLSGSGGRLSPALDPRPLYREAARRTLTLLGTPQSDPILDAAIGDLLLHRDGNLADCESLLVDMLGLRDQWGTLIPLAAPHLDDAWLDANVLPRLQRALEQAICTGLSAVAHDFPPDILRALTELASEMAGSPGHNRDSSPIAICREFSQSPGCAAEDLEHWKALAHLLIKQSKPCGWRKAFAKNYMYFEIERRHKARLVAIIASLSHRPDLVELLSRISALPPAQYPVDQWSVAKSLFRVLNRSLIQLQLVFAERGECDFPEFTLLARAALAAESGPEDLASALGARLQHLLVDEMQDTSAGQYELLRLLTASWDGHSQTVFLVGDPRQSIYLFRQARVESFLQTLQTCRLGELPLTPLQLTANFRSQQTLVVHFNDTFGLLFPEAGAEPTAGSLPYSPAESVLPPSRYAGGLIWHPNPVEIRPALPLPPQSLLTPAQLRQRQAKRDASEMRHIIERWFRKPLPAGRTEPWKIAVLVRNRTHLIEITAEFDKDRPNPIPYRAVDIVPLSDRQEVLDLTALTRALLHPADRVAALAVLRAPWCGLSLASLHTLTGADDPNLRNLSIRRLIADRGHLLAEESIERLKRVWEVLEAAAAQRSRLSTARLVERAWRSLGGNTWLAQPELNNARRFFRLLDELEAEAGSSSAAFDLNRLADRLQSLYAEPALAAPNAPSVELLTIHRAKGLEWDVVLVPALERSPAVSRGRLLTWSELEDADPSGSTGPAPILIAPIAAKGEEVDALTTWIKDIHKRREAAERKRLFYVASTRAREELHLFAAPDLTSRGDLNPRWDSLLKSAWAAAKPRFDELDRAHAGIITLPTSLEPATFVVDESAVFDIAASASVLRPKIQRLPLDFDPRKNLAAHPSRLPYGDAIQSSPSHSQFARPEGSFAARSLGTAVHACLEILASRLRDGSQPSALLAELPSWTPRIAAILRADGLPRATVDRLTRETRATLENALQDPNGHWLLAPHSHSDNEYSLTAWFDAHDHAAQPTTVRIDRVFHAGPEPGALGDSFLWIIDYKTARHSAAGLNDFLAAQRAAYGPQLETYARILAPARSMSPGQVRLALYFPAVPRLDWWTIPASSTGN